MLIDAMRVVLVAVAVACAAGIAAVATGTDSPAEAASDAKPGTPAADAPPAFDLPPGRAQDVDAYSLTVPNRLKPHEPDAEPDPVSVRLWRDEPAEGVADASLGLTVDPRPIRVALVRDDVLRLLNEQVSAVAKAESVADAKREPASRVKVGGIEFRAIRWTGTADQNRPCRGVALAAVDGDRVVLARLFTAGPKAEEALAILEGTVGTLKRR